ncbi:unnamed protein product [Bursaphelenchus xylophilus]|uniref:(pine wood nematode) hypothetical protein n=1 Tax=Bursaphelenchus xylophilus TaxID=6326 RepID=A0A1I7RNT5_BURXY|nr:unnamed protein product [Bursaphelenchus xylophilus]CAG9124276.1 unnamed protein product [Bursaphelenchus xylophilus]
MSAEAKISLNISEWADYKAGDEFPDPKKLVVAFDRPLRTPFGSQEQYVALWYRHGHPIMGRVWSCNGRIAASFSDGDKEFTGKSVGSLQILVRPPKDQSGFAYCWKTFASVAKYDNKDYHPVHINFVTPCILVTPEGYESLGGANIKEEYAQSTVAGNVIRYVGRELENFNVLCRKICHDTMQI